MFPYGTDSQQLAALESLNRRRILIRLHHCKKTNQSLADYIKHVSTSTIQLLILEEYHLRQGYQSLESYIDATANDTNGVTENRFKELGEKVYWFSTYILQNPPRTHYLKMLTQITDTIRKYIDIQHSADAIERAYGELLAILLEYAESCADEFKKYRDYPLKQIWGYYEEHAFEPNKSSNDYLSLDPIFKIYEAFNRLQTILYDRRTYPEIFKFVITHSLGSSAAAYVSELEYPFLATVLLPFSYPKQISELIGLRYDSIEDEDESESFHRAKDIDDEELQKLERLYQSKIQAGDYSTLRNAIINYSMPPVDIGEEFDFAQSPASSKPTTPTQSKRKQDKKKKKDPFQEHPDVIPEDEEINDEDVTAKPKADKGKKIDRDEDPNDDDYEPDPTLAALAINRTERVQADPDKYKNLDHMTRFKSKDENPRNVSKYSMGENDYFVTSRTRYGNQTYMVTYTRKSHKPIFNLVN